MACAPCPQHIKLWGHSESTAAHGTLGFGVACSVWVLAVRGLWDAGLRHVGRGWWSSWCDVSGELGRVGVRLDVFQ